MLRALRKTFCLLFILVRHAYSVCLSSIEEDIVFVLDSSGSISWWDWYDMLDFVAYLVRNSIPPGSRIGEVVYGNQVSIVFGLEQYSDHEDIAVAIENTVKLGSTTRTKRALRWAWEYVFVPAWDDARSKKIVLITDGQPTDNPCEIACSLKKAGIEVIIVAVGGWYYTTNMDCLINDVDSDIIELGSFDELEDNLGTLEEVICVNDFDINIIEVQPYVDSDVSTFIEIYNVGGEMDFYGIELTGMYTGEISTSTLVAQGNILLISDDFALSSSCATDCIFYHWTGSVESYAEQNIDGTINEGFDITIYYDGAFLHNAQWVDGSNFPKVAQDHSFELILPSSNNKIGQNWRSSCQTGGSPGEQPEDCTGCENDSDCQFQGDNGATCDTSVHECNCVSQGYYSTVSTCEPLPVPSNCIVHKADGYDDRYYFNWIQPVFLDALAFMRIEITFRLAGSSTESKFEETNAPPTSNFEMDNANVNDVRIAAVFNDSAGANTHWTEEFTCVYQEAPTVVPSISPTKRPTDYPTGYPTRSTVPPVDSCTLQITDSSKVEAVISWVYSGGYTVGGVATDPTGFNLRWGELDTSFFSDAEHYQSSADIVLVANWDYTNVVATVTVKGYEAGGAVFSNQTDCTVEQATPSPVAYPVPAPDSCIVDVTIGATALVTIYPPSEDYTVANGDIVTLGYLVRVETTSFTNYILGYDGTMEQSIIIPSVDYTVYAVSLGTEGDDHPESDEVECDIITLSPTSAPTPASTAWEVPALSSCEVMITRKEIGESILATISWVKGSQYQHDGADADLFGFKYQLGGTSGWSEVEGQDVSSIEDLWAKDSANARLTTYMAAVGKETIDGILQYPASSLIPCVLNTMDPTMSPSEPPTVMPSLPPTRLPTGTPTFEQPVVSFIQTVFSSNEVRYNCQEGRDPVEIQVALSPASLFPVTVHWEIRDLEDQPVTDGFNETSGGITFQDYRTNYKTLNPGCSEYDEACIPGYECLSHFFSDYCVKDVGTVYEKIKIFAYDDSIPNEDPQIVKVVFTAADEFKENEFYLNSSHYDIHSTLFEANLVVYDADSQEFCVADPSNPGCGSVGDSSRFKPWHWIVMLSLIFAAIAAGYCAWKQNFKHKKAKRDRQIAQEILDDEVRIAEDGYGAGMTATVNPLAWRGSNEVEIPDGEFSISSSEEQEEGYGHTPFTPKEQFAPMELVETFQ